jgi:hypothetical protein
VSGGYPDQQGEPAASGAVVVPVRLVERWERAYRQYGQASTRAARSPAGDRPAARAVAATSREVAAIWREIATTPGLPWWVLAALRAAADAFEAQARDWQARSEFEGGASPARAPVTRRPTDHG